jgi:tetratricopeptide (TPR) repeat protein
MARVSLETKDFKSALDHTERVIHSVNKSVQQEAYLLMGSAQVSFGRIKSALESYNKAVELGSTDPHLHILIAQAYVKEYLSFVRLNNLEPMAKKALAETDKALEITPNYIYAYVTKHQIYMMLKDTKKADEIGKKIVSLLPKDTTLTKEQKDFYALYYKKVPTVTVTKIKVEKK